MKLKTETGEARANISEFGRQFNVSLTKRSMLAFDEAVSRAKASDLQFEGRMITKLAFANALFIMLEGMTVEDIEESFARPLAQLEAYVSGNPDPPLDQGETGDESLVPLRGRSMVGKKRKAGGGRGKSNG